MQQFDDAILLPDTLEKFEALVDRLCLDYSFQDKRHVAAVLARVIKHLPADQAYTTDDYIYQTIHKSYANHVASYIADKNKHEVQVEMLYDMILKDRNNQQAWDELQKASDQGSEFAKKYLEQLKKEESPSH